MKGSAEHHAGEAASVLRHDRESPRSVATNMPCATPSHTVSSTTATLILFFGAKTSTFAAYQTTIGGQEPSTNVKVSL